MKRRQAVGALVAITFVLLETSPSSAQSSAKGPVIGLLDAVDRVEWWDAFRQQLRELGYVEGRNVRFEQRFAKGNLDALPGLAKELVQLKVAVIVTGGAAAAVAAERATRTIPIVMASGTDQVSLGLAATLARPGGNVTGLASINSDLMAKRFELLREIVPKMSRLAVLWHADNPSSMASVRDIEASAAKSRVGMQSFGIRSAEDFAGAFSAMAKDRFDALIVVSSPFIYAERRRLVELALKYKIPAMYGAAEYADAGGLVSYAPSYPRMFRQAAIYVDKILRGANPGDMPIEQPTMIELVINANTARSTGVAIPTSILVRANRVIQ